MTSDLRTTLLPLIFFCALAATTTHAQTVALRRITDSPDTVTNLHPVISADAGHIFYESSYDATTGDNTSFHAMRADIGGDAYTLRHIAPSRASSAAISQDGSSIVFASSADLIGENADRNSEIYLYAQNILRQLTHTRPRSITQRIGDGCYHPSLSRDGRYIAFSANRDLIAEANADGNFEIYLYDTADDTLTQITDTRNIVGALEPQLSADGARLAYILDETTETSAPALRQLILRERANDKTIFSVRDSSLHISAANALSADGSRLIYSAADEQGANQIFLADTRADLSRQLTFSKAKKDDIELSPVISGDGTRIAYATRRNLNSQNSDGSAEIYLQDLPTNKTIKITSAPAGAIASETTLAFNGDGTALAFNFSRLLSKDVENDEDRGNGEIYLAQISLTTRYSESLKVFSAATFGRTAQPSETLAPDQLVVATGDDLARTTFYAAKGDGNAFPLMLGGTTVTVNDVAAQLLYVSPTQIHFLIPPETALGERRIVVRNIDGYMTQGAFAFATTAPAIFTFAGTSRGVFAAADSLSTASPFAATQKITAIGTGFLHASALDVFFNGTRYDASPLVAATNVRGIDQVSFAIPATLRGAGRVSFAIEADARQSVAVELDIAAARAGELIINEVLADPPDGINGDANHDGARDGSDDEFVEFVNASENKLSLANWTLSTRALDGAKESVVHKFASGELAAGDAIVVFGGGRYDSSAPVFGGAQIVSASSGRLNLTNTGIALIVRDATGAQITEFKYGTKDDVFGGNAVNQSLTRAPDVTGDFTLHATARKGVAFSPGTKSDGSFFAPRQSILTRLEVSPSEAIVRERSSVELRVRVFDQYERPLPDVSCAFLSRDENIARVEVVASQDDRTIYIARVFGQSVGATEINVTATYGTKTLSAATRVVIVAPPQRVARLDVSPVKTSLNRGLTTQLVARAFDDTARDVPQIAFKYDSRDLSIATVDDKGVVRGVGCGATIVTVSAPDNYGGQVASEVAITVTVPLIINEILADVPPDDPATAALEGDANGDGVRNADDDEFIELQNASAETLDVSGLIISDATGVRYTFPPSTVLAPYQAAIVFGGGQPPGTDVLFGGAFVARASSLGLNDAGDKVTLTLKTVRDVVMIDAVSYGTAAGDAKVARDQSLVRVIDNGNTTSMLVGHLALRDAAGRTYSPGMRGDGTPFNSAPLTRLEISPANVTVKAGETQIFRAHAYTMRDRIEIETNTVSFIWSADGPARNGVANSVNAQVTIANLSVGASQIKVSAGGLEAVSVLNVVAPITNPRITTPVPGQILINEVLTAYADSSAQPRRDFVELLNRTDDTLDVSGAILSFRPAGSGNNTNAIKLPGAAGSRTTLIAPHDYFLIANGAETYGVKADYDAAAFSFDLNNTTGAIKIELGDVKLDGIAYQGGTSALAAAFDGYGEGEIFRFTSGTTNDLVRSPEGKDSDDNDTDFRRNGTSASVTPKNANPTVP